MSEARNDPAPPRANSSPILRTPHIDLEAQSPRPPDSDPPLQQVASSRSDSLDTLRRRPKRARTARTYRPQQRGKKWQPGQEPGIDPSAPHDGGSASSAVHELRQECQITVVDYSESDMQMHELDNRTLPAFMESPREKWADCRWINVNGLSWDVIKLLGNQKGFHRLAIEDLMNTKSRTKVDWYSDHTYRRLLHDTPFTDWFSTDDTQSSFPYRN